MKTKHELVGTSLVFSWSVSRGRDTYGYNICTLRNGRTGAKLARCSGGGYDMKGTCLSDWMEAAFQPELIELAKRSKVVAYDDETHTRYNPEEGAGQFYGLTAHTKAGEVAKVTLDGACGFESMRSILQAIGLDVRWIADGKKTDTYLLEEGQ